MAVADPTKHEPGQPRAAAEPNGSDRFEPRAGRAWWHRYMAPEERRRVMADLAITRVEHWNYGFVLMLTLSVIVATMGLSLDSAAVVIGAMLLAPLMQPVLATGGCLSMALFTKSLVALAKVAAATVWSIGIAYAISWILPNQDLTAEVLSRTQPDIKDLAVALAAGTAGAYATVRADVSSSLPGVAVAVALVPPLASVGVTLEHGDRTLALGALLLYIANLAAIVAASIVVFVITGFVPPRRLSQNLVRLSLATVGLTAVVVMVAVPLYRATIDTIERQDNQQLAREIVADWLGDLDDDLDPRVTVDREAERVVVELRGFEQPPDQGPLIEAMREEFPDFDVPVQWVRLQQATTTTLPPPEPTEQLLAEIRVAVEEWLTENGLDSRIEAVALDEHRVRIDVASTDQPPAIEGLAGRLQAIDPALNPDLRWAQLQTITEDTGPSPLELTAEAMRDIVDEWAAERGLVVASFDYDGSQVLIDVLGPREPSFGSLQRDLWDEAGQRVLVEIYFIQRERVTTTLPPDFPIS